MVVVKGGGVTYQISSGKIVPWEEVPEHFKNLVAEQKEIEPCVPLRTIAEQCIADHGFWHASCVEKTEAFHLCQSNTLKEQLPPRKVEAPTSSSS